MRLRRQIPYTRGHGPAAHGREVPADEALRIGLIGRVVPDGEALDEALEIAAVIGANGPLAVEAIKRSVRETEGMSEVDGLARELEIGWPIFPPRTRRRGRGPSPRSDRPTTPARERRAGPGARFPGVDGPARSTGDVPLNRLAAAMRRISSVTVGQPLDDEAVAAAAEQWRRWRTGSSRRRRGPSKTQPRPVAPRRTPRTTSRPVP